MIKLVSYVPQLLNSISEWRIYEPANYKNLFVLFLQRKSVVVGLVFSSVGLVISGQMNNFGTTAVISFDTNETVFFSGTSE